MRYVNVDKLMRKIFEGDDDKPWFGNAENDAKVIRFIDQFFYDDIDYKAPDPDKEVFTDCNLTIICKYYDERPETVSCHVIDPQYDKPWDLDYIRSKNPTARIIVVIAETALYGDVWEYGNYGPCWVHQGTTRGFA